MAERLCPKCAQAMARGRQGLVELDVCLLCGGIWFDAGELPEILRSGGAAVHALCGKVRSMLVGPAEEVRRLPRCPDCRTQLVATDPSPLPGGIVEGCKICRGSWLSCDALAQAAARLPRPAAVPQPAAPPPGTRAGTPERRPAPPTAPIRVPPAQHPGSNSASAPTEVKRCPGCGQPNAESAAVCWACGHLLQHVAAGVCPQCQGTFLRIRSDTVDLCVCDGCGGIWLERDRLGALLLQTVPTQDRLIEEIRAIRTGRIRKFNPALLCPQCQLIMFSAPIGQLTVRPVHTCPKCRATFLGEGLLAELISSRRLYSP
jgi:Zn-finger nucleic acid-binding protein